MRTNHKSMLVLAAIGMLGAASAALAVPVQFSVTGATQAVGSGYGQDPSETSSPTLLDVRFTNSFTSQNFVLNAVNDQSVFGIGAVSLREPSAGGGISSNETDDLGVSWTFTFTNPLAAGQLITATATATAGSVSDSAVDYLLDWSPVTVDFGSSGQFAISLNDLSFNASSTTAQTQTATITLLAADQVAVPAQVVPEPGSMALVGLGLGGLGLALRKRNKPSQTTTICA